uniref:Expansin-like EG45 domain-containing protein n=1 Tax=Meloidogyne javanica TaxID=6303 RepID=A0A915LMZ5_MELJA
MPPASATCGGCPTGYTQSCYPSQADSNPANDIADVAVQCGVYSTFCACPSNGQQCYTFNQPNQVTDVQLYTFCDAGGSNIFTNNAQTVTFVQQTDGAGNLQPFSQTSPYVKAPTIAVSCDGCNTISTNNANTGTATTCSGPLTTVG